MFLTLFNNAKMADALDIAVLISTYYLGVNCSENSLNCYKRLSSGRIFPSHPHHSHDRFLIIICWYEKKDPCVDPGIFVRGGGPGQSDKKKL